MNAMRHKLSHSRWYMAAVVGCLALVSGCSDNLTEQPERGTYQGAEPPALDCIPNLDGRITADELQPALDVPVTYRISPDGEQRTVDIAGATDPSGIRVWDWSTDDESDLELTIEANSLADRWFASDFPGATFVSQLDAAGSLIGVYSEDDAGVYLHGYASPQSEPNRRTLVVYDSPVAVYRFPLEVGAAWVDVAEVRNATVAGLPYAGRDTYDVRVDEVGEMWLPNIEFTDVLRVRTQVTVSPAVGEAVSRRQVGYVFECFGEVARAVSQNNETDPDFTTAVEVRRLGF